MGFLQTKKKKKDEVSKPLTQNKIIQSVMVPAEISSFGWTPQAAVPLSCLSFQSQTQLCKPSSCVSYTESRVQPPSLPQTA